MKKLTLLFAFVALLASLSFAVPTTPKKSMTGVELASVDQDFLGQLQVNNIEDFLNLTPKKFKEQTGKKLGIKNAIKLKLAQKVIKKGTANNDGIPKGLYIVGAIIGFAWLLMGIMDNWNGNNWWISLILYILFWLPGLIHALVKMGDYYN